MQHVVRKQILEMTLENSRDAFHIQNEMSRFYWSQLIPVLEKIFDELSERDEFIQIDKLELDLGILYAETLGSGGIIPGIRQLLLQQVKDRLPGENVKAAGSRPKNIVRQWLFYMQHGRLEWNTVSADKEWYEKVMEALATDHNSITSLRSLIINDDRIVKRIVYLHDAVFLKQLTEALTAERQDDIKDFISNCSGPGGLMKFISANSISSSTVVLSFISPGEKEIHQELWENVLTIAASSKEKVPAKKLIELVTGQLISKLKISEKSNSRGYPEAATSGSGEIEKTRETSLAKRQPLKEDKSILEEGIFVHHAGLVLLHPFLPSIFKRLQLIQENNFIDDAAHRKALHLLHYLTTGETAQQEYELLMPKILTAYPMEEIVPLNFQLTDTEKEEADRLIEAVIERWEILRKTSVDGLREAFLQRSGKFFMKNDNYYLQVEHGSIDMLLDHLPWNLSIVKMPWMNYLLRVEWR